MKKVALLSLVLCSVSLLMAAPANRPNAKNTRSGRVNAGIHPWNVEENNRNKLSEEDANWSLLLHGGFNVFDGDMNVNQGKEAKHSVSAPSAGLGVEYKFNPTWGLGLDYTFRQVGVTGNTDGDMAQQNLSNLLRGFQHEASAYLTFDLFNLFIPRAKTKLFALNLIAGGSFMAYRNTNQTPAAKTVKADGIKMNVPNYWKNKTATADYQQAYPDGSASRVMDKYDYVGGFFGGASFDFNVSRSIALGIRALYHFYGNDKIDGRPDVGPNNDGVFDTELLLRYKIQADKKSHVNNYVNRANYSDVSYSGRRARKDTVVVLQRDTVEFFHRDTIEIFHKDTVEFFHKDTVLMMGRGGDTTNIYNGTINYITNPESEKENYFYVYFNPDRYNLSDEALVIIQQVADRMTEEPNLYAAIIGYCDNVGSATYNKRLGQERAQNVLEELQLEHGIETDRMFAISRGIVVGKRSSAQYAPNRRVEIRLVERSFFNELRAQYREDIELQKAYIKQRGVKQSK